MILHEDKSRWPQHFQCSAALGRSFDLLQFCNRMFISSLIINFSSLSEALHMYLHWLECCLGTLTMTFSGHRKQFVNMTSYDSQWIYRWISFWISFRRSMANNSVARVDNTKLWLAWLRNSLGKTFQSPSSNNCMLSSPPPPPSLFEMPKSCINIWELDMSMTMSGMVYIFSLFLLKWLAAILSLNVYAWWHMPRITIESHVKSSVPNWTLLGTWAMLFMCLDLVRSAFLCKIYQLVLQSAFRVKWKLGGGL